MCRYITSDCDAVSIIHDAQGYAKVPEDAVADVLKAGTTSLTNSYFPLIKSKYLLVTYIKPNECRILVSLNYGPCLHGRKMLPNWTI